MPWQRAHAETEPFLGARAIGWHESEVKLAFAKAIDELPPAMTGIAWRKMPMNLLCGTLARAEPG
jgi:hypothetical protein